MFNCCLKIIGIITLCFFSLLIHAETIKNYIRQSVSNLEIDGVSEVVLHTPATENYVEANYDSKENGKVSIIQKQDTLYLKTTGTFYAKPIFKIYLAELPKKYIAKGVGNAMLYLDSVNSFYVDLSGVNQAKLIGKGNSLDFKVSGTSSIDITEFQSKENKGYLTGISSLYIKKTSPLNIEKSGISKVVYYD